MEALKPHDASEHHYPSLKNDLFFLHLAALERKLSKIINNNSIYFHWAPTSSHLYPLQVEKCHSISQLVVDKDDDGKFTLKRDKMGEIYSYVFNLRLKFTNDHVDTHIYE